MKALLVIILLAAVTEQLDIDPRIVGGFFANYCSVPSYVALQIEYERGIRQCGGLLRSPEDQIITAASCVYDAAEGKAANIKFAFGQSQDFSRNKINFTDIFRVASYNQTNNASADDLAVIVMQTRITTSKKIAGAVPSTENRTDIYVGENLLACGFGVIDNFRNRTNRLKCTTLRAVPNLNCSKALNPTATVTPTGIICTWNQDSGNVCSGDFGDPVYSNKTGFLVPVGVVSYFPDSKVNARCTDGHYVVITQLGNYTNFLNAPSVLG